MRGTTNNLVMLFRKGSKDLIRDGSDKWKHTRQRTPHPNLVPSLYNKVTLDQEGGRGGLKGHTRFKVAHVGGEE